MKDAECAIDVMGAMGAKAVKVNHFRWYLYDLIIQVNVAKV